MSTAVSAATARGPAGVHTREHGSLLAAAEKRLLVWIASRLPSWINSDHLTAVGTIAMVGAGAAFVATPRWPSALATIPLFLAINWFGDSLDGTVARVRNHQRPRYGFYLDHVVDLLNSTLLFGGMACSGLLEPALALGLLVAYLLLCAESFLATHAVGIFRLSFGGFGPTELRILLSAGALVAMTRPVVSPFGFGPVRLFDLGAAIAIAGMGVVFILSAYRNARELYLAEPLPRSER
jgi:archaetidylinositol phosphate synthase